MAKELELGDGVIYITDQENMVGIMSANIGLNQTKSRIVACELDWQALPCFTFIFVLINFGLYFRAAPIPDHLACPDIILAADCVYFEPAFPLLHETLLRLTHGRNVEVYMAYKKRRKVCIFSLPG